MASIIRVGHEQQVNTNATGSQSNPDVTMLADGGWVVTWRGTADRTAADVYQQRFNRDGSPRDGEIMVNTFARGTLLTSTTAALDDGGWVVAWVSTDPFDPTSQAYGVYLQRFSKDGEAIGGEERVAVSPEAEHFNVTVTGIDGGGWVVAWQSGRQDGTGSFDIVQRQYDHEGEPKDPVLVPTEHTLEQKRPSIARLEGGGWIVTWDTYSQDGNGLGIFQQRYNANGGRVEGEKQVNTHIASDQVSSSVAALEDGGWIVTWVSSDQDGNQGGIYQQRYYADGTPRGGEQRVNTYRTLDQILSKVAGLDDGGWIVTWQSRDQDGSGNGIYQQRYDKNGVAIRGEQRVNVATEGGQEFQDVTAMADGGWVVTWQSPDDDNAGVFQRRYETVAAFGAGVEDGSGTDDSEVFDVLTGGLDLGDTLDAGGGIDTLRMIGSGILELTAPARISGIEIIQGSGGNDDIVANVARLSSVIGVQGGAGQDRLHLQSGNYDFTSKFVGGIEAILLIRSNVTFADKATALLAHSQRQDSSVVVLGDTFTSGERQQLYQQGIRQATDAGGMHVLQQAQISLSTHAVQENAVNGAPVATLSATDPNPGDGLRFELLDSAGGRFALSGQDLVVANGALLDYESGASHRIVVRIVDEGGIATDAAFTIALGDVPVETVRGTASTDALTGGSGMDVLYGGLGKDTLTGGTGRDIFVFDTRPNPKSNLDRIVDFNVKDDTIWLDNKVFTKLGKAGSEAKPAPLKKDFFTVGSTAKDKNDYLIYDKAKGVLFYDADGSGKGKAVEIATLSKKLSLTSKDFFVI